MKKNLNLTLLQSFNNAPITKRLTLTTEGNVVKTSLAYNAANATARTLSMPFGDFVKSYEDVTKYQAIMYGIAKESSFSVLASKAKIDTLHLQGITARNNETFHFAQSPGIFMGDVDNTTLQPKQLRELLIQILPVFSQVPMLIKASTSSNIINTQSNEVLRGLTGYRLLFPVTDASKIAEFGQLLHAHFWLNGGGHFDVSKSGSLLDRSYFDTAVWQPSRIDFCAGAICEAPLMQKTEPMNIFNVDADFLDIHTAINNLTLSPTQEAQLKHLKAEAKKAKLPEAQYIRDQYISRKSAELVVASGLTDDEARHTIKSAMDSQVLYSDFRIELTSGDLVTVAEILSNPKKYHGQHCADPLEPDYHNDNRIGYIIINTRRSIIYSHAHGGTTYQLSMKRGSLIISAGKTADAVDDVVNLLRKNAGLYNVGSELAYFNGDNVSVLARDSLAYVLGKLIQFAKLNSKREVVNIDPSDKLVTQFIALGEQRNLPKLNAVSDVPFLALDGRVCDKDGYDPETKILLTLPEGGDFSVPSAPTLKMVEEALAFVWHPFKHFPFDSDISRAVFLSFLLTTVCRKSLPTAPALAIDAPDAGTGKSLLSAAIGLLMQGKIPANTPQVQSDDEMRKKLTSMLMQGDEVIVIDNIKGTFKSPVFEIFLTSEYYTDRVLGSSKMAMLPNKTLTIFNGNNLTLSSDLNRRVLTARIDAGIEAPYKRKFDLNPLDYIRTHRIDMIRALLLLIRGYLSSGAGPLRSTGMASFDDWERIVRQTVCWLGQVQSTLPLTDPNLSIDRNYEKDDERQSISRIFEAWHAVFGDSFLLSKLLIKKINEPICPLIDDQETVDRLGEALLEVFDDGVDSQKLGRWLEKHVDRVVDGFKLIKSDKRLNGCVQWKVIRV